MSVAWENAHSTPPQACRLWAGMGRSGYATHGGVPMLRACSPARDPCVLCARVRGGTIVLPVARPVVACGWRACVCAFAAPPIDVEDDVVSEAETEAWGGPELKLAVEAALNSHGADIAMDDLRSILETDADRFLGHMDDEIRQYARKWYANHLVEHAENARARELIASAFANQGLRPRSP
jgi:hypothetical protein